MFNKLKEKKIFIFFLVFVLSLSAFTFIKQVEVNDFYWHVKTGEWMIKNQAVPKVGIFSWYAESKNLPWVAHEWLFAVIIHLLEANFGSIGVFLYSFLTGTILMLLLLINLRKEIHKNPFLIFLWFFMAVSAINLIISARPHMLMFILTALLTMLLYKFKENPNTKLIYFLPVISLLWANIHGGSSNMVYILPIIMIVTSIKDFKLFGLEMKSLPQKKLILLGLLTLISAGLIAVNPNGLDMLIYPYANMGDGFMLNLITEWRSPDAKLIDDVIIIFLPIVIHVVVFAVKNKKIKVEDILFFLFFTYMTMRSIRFIYFIIIIQSLTLFKDLEFAPMKENKKLIATIAMFIGLFLFGFRIYAFDGPLAKVEFSAEIRDAVMEEKPERILNDYNYGGYLIYHDIPVYVDGRADIYSAHNLKDYVDFTKFKIPDIEKYLKENGFDYILLQKSHAVVNYLEDMDYLEVIAEDTTTVFYRINPKLLP